MSSTVLMIGKIFVNNNITSLIQFSHSLFEILFNFIRDAKCTICDITVHIMSIWEIVGFVGYDNDNKKQLKLCVHA